MAPRYPREKIEQLRERAKNAPDPAPSASVSGRELVQSLASELGQMLKRGYSVRELAEWLNREGVEVSAGTLGGYLKDLRGQRRKGPRRQKPRAPVGETRSIEGEE